MVERDKVERGEERVGESEWEHEGDPACRVSSSPSLRTSRLVEEGAHLVRTPKPMTRAPSRTASPRRGRGGGSLPGGRPRA